MGAGALPMRAKTSRGRTNVEKECRAGCSTQETLNLISQHCFCTHDQRSARHDNIAAFFKKNLQSNGFSVVDEPKIKIHNLTQKPDLLAIKDESGLVLDDQIVTDGRDLERMNGDKTRKYYREDMLEKIREVYRINNIKVLTTTLNFRGVWCKSSADNLIAERILNKNELALISIRAIMDTLMCFAAFNKTTMVREQGIG